MAYNLVLANTCFKKDAHVIAFKNGHNNSWIDFLLTRKTDRILCKDLKLN